MANKNTWFLLTLATLFIFLTVVGCGSDNTEKISEQSPGGKLSSQGASEEIPTAEPGDINAGKLIYEKHCHYCHGKNGRGKGAVAIAVSPNPADFIRDDKRMSVTDKALYESLSYGISKENSTQKLKKALAMPPFMGVLSPKERWDVIAYIRELVRQAKNESIDK